MLSPIAAADHPTLETQPDAAGSSTALSAERAYRTVHDDDVHCEGVHGECSANDFSLNAAYEFTVDLTLGFEMSRVSRKNIREGEHHHVDQHRESDVHEIAQPGDSTGFSDLSLSGRNRCADNSDRRLTGFS